MNSKPLFLHLCQPFQFYNEHELFTKIPFQTHTHTHTLHHSCGNFSHSLPFHCLSTLPIIMFILLVLVCSFSLFSAFHYEHSTLFLLKIHIIASSISLESEATHVIYIIGLNSNTAQKRPNEWTYRKKNYVYFLQIIDNHIQYTCITHIFRKISRICLSLSFFSRRCIFLHLRIAILTMLYIWNLNSRPCTDSSTIYLTTH